MLKKLTAFFPRKSANLRATLKGVDGFTGRGAISFTAWSNGARQMEVSLRGVAGRQAQVRATVDPSVSIVVENGRADAKLDTRTGDALPPCVQNEQLTIVQNDIVILTGQLLPTR